LYPCIRSPCSYNPLDSSKRVSAGCPDEEGGGIARTTTFFFASSLLLLVSTVCFRSCFSGGRRPLDDDDAAKNVFCCCPLILVVVFFNAEEEQLVDALVELVVLILLCCLSLEEGVVWDIDRTLFIVSLAMDVFLCCFVFGRIVYFLALFWWGCPVSNRFFWRFQEHQMRASSKNLSFWLGWTVLVLFW
jgi:hypothetical protein